jgi:hypothetical protein
VIRIFTPFLSTIFSLILFLLQDQILGSLSIIWHVENILTLCPHQSRSIGKIEDQYIKFTFTLNPKHWIFQNYSISNMKTSWSRKHNNYINLIFSAVFGNFTRYWQESLAEAVQFSQAGTRPFCRVFWWILNQSLQKLVVNILQSKKMN